MTPRPFASPDPTPRPLPSAEAPPPSQRAPRSFFSPEATPPPMRPTPRGFLAPEAPPSQRAPRSFFSPESAPPPMRPTPRAFLAPDTGPPSVRSPQAGAAAPFARESPASPAAADTAPFDTQLVRVLSRFISELNSTALLSACARASGLRRDQLGPQHVPAIIAQAQASFEFFGVAGDRRNLCIAQLRALVSEQSGAREEPTIVVVEREGDIVRSRLAGRMICQKLGFSEVGTAKVVTAISELSRNIVKYAGRGSITIRTTGEPSGVEVIASDRGPGIADVDAVLRTGYRSKTGMGAGLRGTRALMDFFEIRSRPGEGTTITIRKGKS